MNIYAPGKEKKDTKIVVAMSGGVDSSTVAALLKEEGYNVVGITLQLYDYKGIVKTGTCCAGQDIYDAKRVAEKLDFPHYVLNYESIFKDAVMEDFADSYLKGETPIPCVRCNQSVKFRDLFKVAKDLGADALATGHYVRRVEGKNGAELHRGSDLNRDQSYFLFSTTREQVDFIHFPLGNLTKQETRAHAARFGLEIADKPDSQDICFVPNGDYASVIEKLRPGSLDKGEIVDLSGKVLGQHNGIINYTIGQRKGLGISNPEPLYVVKIEPEKKQVVVGPIEALNSESFNIKDLNWLGEAQDFGREIWVKIRSLHKGAPAIIEKQENGKATVKLLEPQASITPGQACVAYDGTKVLGGGWIIRN